jgi:threonine/homoserine/homoserine lactone efflux protein
MAVFFTSLLPQFAPPPAGFAQLLALGVLFVTMTLAWLSLYAAVIATAREIVQRTAVWRTLEGVTGAVLIALGVRVATEPA